MISNNLAELDLTQRNLLRRIHDTGKQREFYAQRSHSKYLTMDAKAAAEIADWERQWIAARDRADDHFIDLALRKPPRDRAAAFNTRAYEARSASKFDAEQAKRARERNCAVAEDYYIISEVLRRKAEEFRSLFQEAQGRADRAPVMDALGVEQKEERLCNLRNLERQSRKRADFSQDPEERARLTTHADRIAADLPPLP